MSEPVMWPPVGWRGAVLLSCAHVRLLNMTSPPDDDDTLLCWDCRGENERRPARFYEEWKPTETDLLRHLAKLEAGEHSGEIERPTTDQ